MDRRRVAPLVVAVAGAWLIAVGAALALVVAATAVARYVAGVSGVQTGAALVVVNVVALWAPLAALVWAGAKLDNK